MNILSYLRSILIILLFAAIGCDSPLTHFTDDVEAAIVGGRPTRTKDHSSAYVAMISDVTTNKVCSSVIIHERVLLTAAHCVTNNARALSAIFGTEPLSGRYIMRQVEAVEFHPTHKSDNPVDLALVILEEEIPPRYKVASLPGMLFPIVKDLKFTAIGYGRTSGLRSADTNDSGKLRQVNLQILSTDPNGLLFYVDQTEHKGICTGDSGGPALVTYLGKHYVIGIASATSWIIPAEVSEQNKTEYLNSVDLCTYRSIYVNLLYQASWIMGSIRDLSDKSL